MRRNDLMTKIHLLKMDGRLGALQNGGLSESKRRVLEIHLNECSICSERLARMERTVNALIATRPDCETRDSEADIRASFMLAFEKSQSPTAAPRNNSPIRIYAMAAIALLVCVAAVKLGLRRPERPERAVAINVPLAKAYEEKTAPSQKSLMLQLAESTANSPSSTLSRTLENKPNILKFRRADRLSRTVARASSRRRKLNATLDTEMSDGAYALATKLWEGESDPAPRPEAKLAYNDEPHLIVRLINPVELDVKATIIERPNPALPAYVEAAALTSYAPGRSSWRLCRLIKNGNCITNATSEGESKWGEPISHLSLSITKLVPAAPGGEEALKEMKK